MLIVRRAPAPQGGGDLAFSPTERPFIFYLFIRLSIEVSLYLCIYSFIHFLSGFALSLLADVECRRLYDFFFLCSIDEN